MRLTLLILTSFVLFGSQVQAQILIHAAASLTDALKEAAAVYERQTGERVQFNFGASSLLARQIQEGAPGDIFFSADEEKMDALEKRGLIRKGSRKSLLSNTLVIVVPADSSARFTSASDLLNVKGKVAIAEPQTVPAGIYAKEFLKEIGIWDKINDRLIPTENVRSALAAVESGNVDAGIVYKTDAKISKRAKIAYEIQKEEGPKISYSIAILTTSQSAAKRFYDFLVSPTGLQIYRKYGFLTSD
jgi:molybdate transport system substrate-binding protein